MLGVWRVEQMMSFDSYEEDLCPRKHPHMHTHIYVELVQKKRPWTSSQIVENLRSLKFSGHIFHAGRL